MSLRVSNIYRQVSLRSLSNTIYGKIHLKKSLPRLNMMGNLDWIELLCWKHHN